ncbi:hypothetical protein KIPB_010962, partial [Kipferlia bialata]
ADLEQVRQNKAYLKLRRERQSLPMYSRTQEIAELLDNNQVVVVTGETGSGKSTQLPQGLMDRMIDAGLGSSASLVCTQPRRVAAVSLAQRVSEERGVKCGTLVGYATRDDTSMGSQTR